MDIFKILAFCLLSAVLAVVLKEQKPEYSVLIGTASAVAVITLILTAVAPAVSEIKLLLENSGIDSAYFKIALKALGIAYISEFTADICRDAGQGSMAGKAELAGKAGIFLIALPLLSSILKTALGFIGG